MANNFQAKDANGNTLTFKSTETATVHVPHHNIDVIAAGTNNIGDVDIVTLPADPLGTNADAVIVAGAAGSISAKLRAISRDLVANIVLAAGNNNVGDVDVASVPADPFGANADAVVAAGAAGSISAKLRAISRDIVANIVLAAGGNTIGKVNLGAADSDPFGANADAAATAGSTGSISAKLRAISRDLVSNVVLAAGTNAIGKLAANAGVDIGDVGAKSYTTVTTGEKAGSTSASVFATVTAKMVMIKAQYDNVGRVYIGPSTVTKKDGTTDTTTGYELLPGESTPWMPVDNLNRFYLICDNAGDDVTYLVLA